MSRWGSEEVLWPEIPVPCELCKITFLFLSRFSESIYPDYCQISNREKSLINHQLDPHGYIEFVTICLSLKELLRKSLTRTVLGQGRREFNLSGRQELHLASL